MPNPFYINVCPYLSITGRYTFGTWEIGPMSAFKGEWTDAMALDLSTRFLKTFADAYGGKIDNPALIARKGSGVDGVPPTPDEYRALRSTLEFGVIEGNARRTPESRLVGWTIATTDNADLFVWPVDLASHYITLSRGSVMLSISDGGWRIDDGDLVVRAPLEVEIGGASIDAAFLSAAYDIFFNHTSAGHPKHKEAKRLELASRWLAKAWKNTPSVTTEDRIIFLKTGFEALTNTSKSIESAAYLRELFETIRAEYIEASDELLWTPADKPIYSRVFQGNTSLMTPLEHWFMEFADQRNNIIHEGKMTATMYSEKSSAFEGPFLFIAEWVLRTAIKIAMAGFGFPDMWRGRSSRVFSVVTNAVLTDLSEGESNDEGEGTSEDVG